MRRDGRAVILAIVAFLALGGALLFILRHAAG
jgi:hypothetical protein